MSNVNYRHDPAIYALYIGDLDYFYVGETSVNSQNRLYEHISRALKGHPAPVYQKMREVGARSVQVVDLEKAEVPRLRRMREAWWITHLLEEGYELTNRIAVDGVPNSIPTEMRSRMNTSKRGKPTWISGKHGLDAGWTEARRRHMREQTIARHANRPELHGKVQEYQKFGCRCERCVDAARRWRATLRMERRDLATIGLIAASTNARHGTRYMYEKFGCRCDPCRLAMAQRNARRRGQPIPTVAPPVKGAMPEHGTATRYKHHGCRCDLCREAVRIQRQRRKADHAQAA